MSPQDKRILVTGSSRGIGRGIAKELAAAGAVVVVHGSRESEALDQSYEHVRALAPNSLKFAADLSKPDEIAGLFDNIEKELRGLDVLVNNAAVQNECPLMDMPEKDWDLVMAVDLKAPFLCGQYAARMMRSAGKGGKIINISSVHSQIPLRHYGHYSSAKGGLEQLTRCMALEWADYNIQVNALTVGAIATALTPPDRAAALATAIPANRVGQAEEVARLVAFLCSDGCDFLTGECITIDGGITLGFCANRRDL